MTCLFLIGKAGDHAPVLVASLPNQEDRTPLFSVVAKSLKREDGTQRLRAGRMPNWEDGTPRLSVVELPLYFATIRAISRVTLERLLACS